jgi:hypothetical protein
MAYAQLAANLLGVGPLVPVREREITNIFASLDRSVVRSSVIPSAKYCCSGSLLKLVNGNTMIDRRGKATGGELEVVDDPLAVRTPAMPSGRRWREVLDGLLTHVLKGVRSRSPIWSRTVPETQTLPGAANPSNRTAILTPSP